MTGWADLVVAATVGTASRPIDLAATPEPVAAAAPPIADPAGSLLDAAVAFAVARRAGVRPVRGEIPPPAPEDPRPEVSPLAGELLRRVLVEREVDLAGPALVEVAHSGRRLPDALVPTALALASRHTALRPDTIRACGAVASWLARQNRAWAWAVAAQASAAPAFDPARWETGDRAERLAQLRALRSTDPVAAAAMLRESWPSTAPDERVDLLTVLGPVPHPADEPLLEATLGERRAAVREVAVELLGRLEGSAFRARAADRVRGLVRVEGLGLRHELVVVSPPDFDPAALRDGHVPAVPVPRRGAPPVPTAGRSTASTALRVQALVAAAPLGVWEADTGLAPERLVAMVADPYADPLLAGWVRAVRRERDVRWATALLDHADRARRPVASAADALIALLPGPERDRRVVEGLGPGHGGPDLALLAVATRPWNEAVTVAAGRLIRDAVRHPPGHGLLAVFEACGVALPATAEHAEALRRHAEAAPNGAIWLRAARAAAETIDLRRRLHEELG